VNQAFAGDEMVWLTFVNQNRLIYSLHKKLISGFEITTKMNTSDFFKPILQHSFKTEKRILIVKH